MLTFLAVFGLVVALYAVYSNDLVHSLVSLILLFFVSGVLLIILRLEFLGYMLIIVYVGAIAILFLFVVITLDTNLEKSQHLLISKVSDPFSKLVCILFSLVIFYITVHTFESDSVRFSSFIFVSDYWLSAVVYNNVSAIYISLYTFNSLYLVMIGILLLVTMLCATVLTLSSTVATRGSYVQYQSLQKSGLLSSI